MSHARFGIAVLLATTLAAACGDDGGDKALGSPATTSTTSTGTDTGGSCTPACSGKTPFCSDAGACVACRTKADCKSGEVCQDDGGKPACLPGCKTDADCEASGAAGSTCCDGACVDTKTSASSCGACGHACGAPNAEGACEEGACVVGHCTPGYADCDGDAKNGCEADLTTDPQNCTACGKACSVFGGKAACANGCVVGSCDEGLADCNHDAADGCETTLATDPVHCGSCDVACATPTHADAVCAAGACGLGACASGYADCDGDPKTGCETDIGKDPASCGACGQACGPDNTCWKGACHLSGCPAGKANCNGDPADGCEVLTASDATNCGACGKVCADPPFAIAGCAKGACGVGSCVDGRLDCDGQPGNGCEADPTSDANHCGACGNACGVGQICEASACKDAPIDLLKGLVDYWKFDGSLAPSWGALAFDFGQGQPLFSGGHVGSAVGITGGPRSTPPSAQLELNADFTLAFWANYLVHLADDATMFEVGGIHVSVHDKWGGKPGVFAQYQAQDANGGGFGGNPIELVDDSGFLPGNAVNQWYFVVVQRKGQKLSMRVNMKGTATVDLTGKSFASGNVQAYVASQFYGYDFGGGIDEAGWWSRALNEAELLTLHNGGAGMSLP